MGKDSITVTKEEAASLLSISVSQLNRTIARGAGPAFYKLGRKSFFPREKLTEWANSMVGQEIKVI